jgi:hypothetical protein
MPSHKQNECHDFIVTGKSCIYEFNTRKMFCHPYSRNLQLECVVCILFISATKSFLTKLMKDTTLIKDKDLAYEIYLVSMQFCVIHVLK